MASALPPHPATQPRTRAAQPKLELKSALPPHPATQPRARSAQPKLKSALPPHPATQPRGQAIQLRAAGPARGPHPATVQRSIAVHPARARSLGLEVAQRSSSPLETEGLEQKLTRYNPRDMAGRCVDSAREVGKVLGRTCVGYVVTVYRDKSGEIRNHIAAVRHIDGHDQVVDATWKQFPFLLDPRSDLRSKPLVLMGSVAEWTDMIAEHTPGISNAMVSQETSLNDALEWMRDQRRTLPAAPAVPVGKTRGCTLF